MDKKSLSSYKYVLDYINNSIFKLEASSFITDFEYALQKSSRTIFPEAKVRGCWFHFCQAVRRRIAQKHNVWAAYLRSNKQAKDIYRKLLVLPLLPAADIKLTFYVIKEHLKECVE